MDLHLIKHLAAELEALALKEDYPELFDLWRQCVDLYDTICILLEEDGNKEEIENLQEKCAAIWSDFQLATKLIRDYDDDRLQHNI